MAPRNKPAADKLKEFNAAAKPAGAVQTVPRRTPAPKEPPAPAVSEAPSGAKMPVKQAILHSQVLLGGFTGENLHDVKAPGIKMIWIRGEGLLVALNGVECLIPSANVKQAILDTKPTGRVVAD